METLSKITVSREFREAMRAEYPGLDKGKKESYWKLLEYLLFSTWRDEELDEIILPASVCATMETRATISARQFLDNFSRDVTPVESRENHRNWGHKCRTIISVDWSERALALIASEKRAFLPNDRVWLSTGNKFRREDEISYRRHTQAEALGMMENAGCQAAFDLLSYLNTLAPNRFASIKKHLDDARKTAEGTKDAERQLTILKHIETQAQPFYRAADKTVRIFSLNDSFLRLQRDVRKTMTQDWITADLRSAQLAIVAKVWDLPELTDFLKTGKSIWRELIAWMSLPGDCVNYETSKSAMKDVLYAVIFGVGDKNLLIQLGKDFANARKALRLLKSHPVMHVLFLARARQLRKIRDDKGGTDAFEKWYDIQYMQVEGKPYKYDSSRSILALIAQSYELQLLQPVIEMAIEAKDNNQHGFSILMWLHDGFCFDVNDQKDVELWKKRLFAAVKEKADALGIWTELELS